MYIDMYIYIHINMYIYITISYNNSKWAWLMIDFSWTNLHGAPDLMETSVPLRHLHQYFPAGYCAVTCEGDFFVGQLDTVKGKGVTRL